ncbi:hypothetical protein L209DRAFT_673327, partial [Thermothelomyces heterothallicus CBS 203.75]
ALASFIDSSSIDVILCSWCFKRNLACHIALGSSYYSKYIRQGRSYNSSDVASTYL